MITLKSCPVCREGSFIEFRSVATMTGVTLEIIPGVKIEAAPVSRYYQCRTCQLIFQNPRFSDAELKVFYGQGYYRQALDMGSEEGETDEHHRAEVDAKIIKEQIGEITSHLDIGAGRGYLLDLVGAKIKVGVEPDVDRIKIKGMGIYEDIDKVSKKSFQLVTLIHTLEHVSDPIGLLKKITKLVDKGGYLVIEVPTWESPEGPLRLAHLYHFEPDVLRLMCKKVGLKVIRTEFTPHLVLICQVNNTG